MNPTLHAAELFLSAGFFFLLLGSLVSAALARACAKRVAMLEAGTRHRALVLLALLPLSIAFTLLLSASLPSLVSLVSPARDHCLTHDDAHLHLCFVHVPHASANPLLRLSLVFLLSYALIQGALWAATTFRALRLLRALTGSGTPRADLGAVVLETSRPLCLTAGLVQPAVLISRGLIELLDAEERAVVLAHEREHVRRKDALVATVVRACTWLHVPSVARFIRRELEIAAEQACDEAAGRSVGDRPAVAAVLLKVEHAAGTHALGALAVGAGDCAIERRVESLLAEPRASSSLRAAHVALAIAAATALAAASGIHHATESLLSLLLH